MAHIAQNKDDETNLMLLLDVLGSCFRGRIPWVDEWRDQLLVLQNVDNKMPNRRITPPKHHLHWER